MNGSRFRDRRPARVRLRRGGRRARRLPRGLLRDDRQGSFPADYRQRHPIAIKEGDRTFEVFVGNARGGLPPAQRAEVVAFAHDLGARGNRRPDHRRSGRHAERACRRRCVARDPRDPGGGRRRAHAVKCGPTARSAPAVLPTIKIHYPRMTAEAGPCGLWPHDIGPSFDRTYNENQPYYNHGCAKQRNLAAMVDNPADLVQPRGETPVYTAAPHHRAREIPQGRQPATIYPDTKEGQDQRALANDQERTANRRHEPPARRRADEHIAPVPRISIQAFCETVETAAAMQAAAEDRRMGKAHLKVQMGGVAAARSLSQFADAERHRSRVGEPRRRAARRARSARRGVRRRHARHRHRPAQRHRALSRAGAARHQRLPDRADRHVDVVRAICGLFSAPDAKPVGRIVAVVGAKGGVGASTVAHNVAWAIARDLLLDAVVADLDLAFGTAGLDYNQDPPQGIADAVFSPERIDTAFVDRLLSKCTDH